MKAYNDLVKRILSEGEMRGDRTGTGTLSVFGGTLEVDVRERFPLVQMKKTLYEKAFVEMLWFLRGDDHIGYLREHGAEALWEPWAKGPRGYVGPIYGVQWRHWPQADSMCGELEWNYIDQIHTLINDLQRNPFSRRHIVSAWNVAELEDMALPPCHRDFQCYVARGQWLDMMVSQRSWDVALGAPFNIAQYALLLHLLARATGLQPRYLRFNYGDAHLYLNHIDQMMAAVELPEIEDECRLIVRSVNTDIDAYTPSDFLIEGYLSHPFIKLPVAV